ncbi:MAG: hypothetical protein AAF585_28970 [Verrucomicrobiota bacterium]
MKSVLVVWLGMIVATPLFAQEEEASDDAGAKTLLRMRTDILKFQNLGRLSIRKLHLCADVKDFGIYEPLENAEVPKGSTLKIYYEPYNLFTSIADDRYEIWFSQDLHVYTADGQHEIFKQEKILNVRRASRTPSLDIFGFNSLTIDALPPGNYKLKGVVRDHLRENAEPVEWNLDFRVVEP